MQSYLEAVKPFPWVKLGRAFEPTVPGFTHGSHPCAVHCGQGLFVLAFTCRDTKQHSHIFLAYATVDEEGVHFQGPPKLALSPGAPGCFDCDGVISTCIVEHAGVIYLYYVGWQNLPEGLWICDTGRGILDPKALTLTKEFSGPVLGRDKDNPLFAAATAFHIEGNTWHTWYNSGVKWEKKPSGWHHHYGIHHATSFDGVHWNCEAAQCIPFADEYEYAFGRPSVYRFGSTYYMWFAHRATATSATYRIGFASSNDGISWNRNDAIAGIAPSVEGWDSEMICYPYVFKSHDKLYMLYNGNDYGRTGFGLAVLRGDKPYSL